MSTILCFYRDSEWAVNIQRDSYASYIGHAPLLAFFAVAENESIGRVRYNFMQVSITWNCITSVITGTSFSTGCVWTSEILHVSLCFRGCSCLVESRQIEIRKIKALEWTSSLFVLYVALLIMQSVASTSMVIPSVSVMWNEVIYWSWPESGLFIAPFFVIGVYWFDIMAVFLSVDSTAAGVIITNKVQGLVCLHKPFVQRCWMCSLYTVIVR